MKISIVTTTYNSEKTIEQTLQSVLSQTYQNYEHIIVDGNSKDSTMELIKKYEEKYNGKLRYISEPDTGIYDAMNKGIKMATGDIIGLLNSDDIYANENVLSKIAETFERNKCDGIHGNLLYMDAEKMEKITRKWITKSTKIEKGNILAHPTLYLTKEAYNKIGFYNLKYKVVSDYDFMIRVLINKEIKLEQIDEYLIFMRAGGASNNGLKGYWYNLRESHQILKDNHFKFAWAITFIRVIKTVWQMIAAKFFNVKEK